MRATTMFASALAGCWLLAAPAVADVLKPADVSGLRVDRSVDDAVLSWQAVTQDAAGNPETVSAYRVYRGTTPDFVPDLASGSNRVAEVAGTSFSDPGALIAPDPYHYLVTAVDGSGNESASSASWVTVPPVLGGSWTETTVELTWTQRNLYEIRHYDVAFLAINQVRDNTSNPYLKGPNALTPPGGHNWHHGVSLQIRLSKAAWIEQNGEIIGVSSKFLITKNKVAPPFRSFNFPILFNRGIDYYGDLTEFAIDLGVIGRYGAYYKFDDVTLGKGVIETVETIKSNKDTLDKILKMCYNRVQSSTKVIEEGKQYEEVY